MTRDAPLRWALVGAGRAGLARGRAIVSDPGSTLVSVWRGRNADRFPAARRATTFDDALDGVDAVALCSPTSAHASQVRAALEAGVHVVVEYPVATSASRARELFALAAAQRRVLHVEHIELLHAPQVILRAHTRRDPIARIRQEFAKAGPDDVPAAQLAAGNLARVHRLVDLCGPVARIAELELAPGRVTGRLVHADGAASVFRWEQSPYLQRTTILVCVSASGDEWKLTDDMLYRGRAPQTLIEAEPLFEQDHRIAAARIRGTGKPYVTEDRIVHALDVLQRIAAGSVGDVPEA